MLMPTYGKNKAVGYVIITQWALLKKITIGSIKLSRNLNPKTIFFTLP
jgi:hypothetical protein